MDDLMNISPSKDDGGISDSELFTPLSPFRPPEENPLLSPMVTPENSARRNLFKGDKDSEYLEYLKSTYAVEESPRQGNISGNPSLLPWTVGGVRPKTD